MYGFRSVQASYLTNINDKVCLEDVLYLLWSQVGFFQIARNISIAVDVNSTCSPKDYDVVEVEERRLPFDGGEHNVFDTLEPVGDILSTERLSQIMMKCVVRAEGGLWPLGVFQFDVPVSVREVHC